MRQCIQLLSHISHMNLTGTASTAAGTKKTQVAATKNTNQDKVTASQLREVDDDDDDEDEEESDEEEGSSNILCVLGGRKNGPLLIRCFFIFSHCLLLILRMQQQL